MTRQKLPNMAASDVDCCSQKALVALHVCCECLDCFLMWAHRCWRDLPQESQPSHRRQYELSPHFIGILGRASVLSPARPVTCRLFNILLPNDSIRIQIEMIDNDEKFPCHDSHSAA